MSIFTVLKHHFGISDHRLQRYRDSVERRYEQIVEENNGLERKRQELGLLLTMDDEELDESDEDDPEDQLYLNN